MDSNTIISIIIVLFLIAFLMYFVYKQIKEEYMQDDPLLKELKFTLMEAFPNEMKNIRLYKGDKSYTINKEKIYICMKDKKGEYYNKDILTHVILHEMAHTQCPEIGHTELFQDIFQDLMERAHEKGIYNIHEPIPDDYCMY